jgi:hypothetical protein
MHARRVDRRRLAVAGGAVLVAMGALTTACGTSGNQTPTTSSTTTTTTTTATTPAPPPGGAPASPTEKSLSPSAGNLFTPDVKAPPAPTEPPGVHHHN